MSDGRAYRIWIDPTGEVWIEDPDAGVLPLAQALEPGFGFAAPVDATPVGRLAATRAITAASDVMPVDLADLWQLHDQLMDERPRREGFGLLALKRAIARRLFRACVLCEHRCGVDRAVGERGVCKVGPVSYVASGYVHLAEEREIAPSYCLTLTGCSWHCVYCHTYDVINRVDQGLALGSETHAELYERIRSSGARTLSFVGGNPDHHLPAILEFLEATPAGFDLPIVWNSNMYGSPELYRLLDGLVDVYLGDLRYGNDDCARRLSGIASCWEPVARNWKQVAGQGALLIARILLLPGHLDCCVRPIVAWLAAELPGVRVSLLDQFHPTYLVDKRAPELARTPTAEELAEARRLIEAAGLSQVEPAG